MPKLLYNRELLINNLLEAIAEVILKCDKGSEAFIKFIMCVKHEASLDRRESIRDCILRLKADLLKYCNLLL